MQLLANDKFPLETGGVLIGYVGGASGDDVVVVAITGPGPRAHHTAITFEPDHEYQTAEIARLYRSSKGVNTYLGDWHTHPRSTADLSRRDKKTLNHIAAHRAARMRRPIMAILGEGSSWVLKAWRLVPGSVVGFRRTRYRGMEVREIR
jgi:integrative and conjugative element protein (TIGR02256 family)